jgi:2'-5' RNA ligase
MKEQLALEVGWFHSKNSVGHITICEFMATDETIGLIKDELKQLSDPLEPVEVHLTGFGSYPNGAFFISPDEASKNSLKPIMKRFYESLSIRHMQISDDPHLSIARRLSPEKLAKAKSLFVTPNVSFLCDGVVLRQFDETIKQFVETDRFPFHSIGKLP